MICNERSSKAKSKAPRLIVIGNGMAGHRLLEALARQGSPYDITVLCEEPYPLMPNRTAIGIDRVNRCVYTADDRTYPYDRLVLATGAVPYLTPAEGYGRRHCLPYRTPRDIGIIKQSAADSRSGVVIGSGLVGLEAAGVLLKLKLETHIVEHSTHLMAMQLDKAGGQRLRDKIEATGIQVHTARRTEAIEPGMSQRYRLRFADGDALEADMVVFSAGFRSADNLANVCGLALGERGGVTVNSHCQSSDPDIYAIGDAAHWEDSTFGPAVPDRDMVRACAAHLLGQALYKQRLRMGQYREDKTVSAPSRPLRRKPDGWLCPALPKTAGVADHDFA